MTKFYLEIKTLSGSLEEMHLRQHKFQQKGRN